MNKEVLEQLLPVLKVTKEGLLRSVDVIQSEAPQVAEQLLRWKFTLSLAWFGTGLVMLVAMLVCSVVLWKIATRNKKEWEQSKEDGGVAVMSMINFIALFIPSAMMLSHLEWIKILIAPKLYLMEYIAHLIKTQ